jgi:hypothetical protein
MIEAAYNNALSNYNPVVANYPQSIRLDNAAYKIGLVYHETEYCAPEETWYVYVANLPNVSAAFLDTANTHVADLTAPTPQNHLCVPTLLNIDTSYAPPP